MWSRSLLRGVLDSFSHCVSRCAHAIDIDVVGCAGAAAAVPAILNSQTFKAADALKLGLADVVVDKAGQAALLEAASKYALELASGARPRRMALYLTHKLHPSSPAEDLKAVEAGLTATQARVRGGPAAVPHPFAFLEACKTGLQFGGEAGVAKEIELMTDLVLSNTARALIHFFFAERDGAKLPGVTEPLVTAAGDGAGKAGADSKASSLPALPKPGKLKRVAVLGGGTMGAGIVVVYLLRVSPSACSVCSGSSVVLFVALSLRQSG
jgi:enoyl-CoA hydratase/3-hydroxyacyl-CoA dehydrogenase